MQIDAKRQSILSHDGHILITGGPGSGKTTIGLLKAQRSVAKLPPHAKILFLSFSRAAVHQIRTCSQRAELQLSQQEKRAIGVQTYHSFFWQFLQSYGPLLGIPQPIGVLLPEDEYIQKTLFVADWGRHREQIARESGTMSYELFPKYASQLLQENTHIGQLIGRRYPVIIVDEFQDTNDSEYAFMKSLSYTSTIVFLADTQQRIYDFREGVRDCRVGIMEREIGPEVFDLADDNHRNPKSDIWIYANAVLSGSCADVSPKHVSIKTYAVRKQPAFDKQQATLLKTAYMSMERDLVKNHAIRQPTIAIVARTNALVTAISDWLNSKGGRVPFPIRHVIDIDHKQLMFSWRFLACIIENSRGTGDHCLEKLLGAVRDFRVCTSRSPATAQKQASKHDNWIQKVRTGFVPGTKLCRELNGMIGRARELSLTENIALDCRVVLRQALLDRAEETKTIVRLLGVRLPFQQPDMTTDNLRVGFSNTGEYSGLADVLNQSVTYQKMIGFSIRTPRCSLLTIHKSKGKEFDGMIIYDHFGQRGRLHSGDRSDNCSESRRLLRVAITRARKAVIIVTPQNDRSLLLPI